VVVLLFRPREQIGYDPEQLWSLHDDSLPGPVTEGAEAILLPIQA